MDYQTIVERCEWYVPAHLKMWRELGLNKSSALTHIVAANHLEAIIECEEVDVAFLISCMSGESAEDGGAAVAESKATMQSELIDKFLSLDDFRITLAGEGEEGDESESESEQDWELVDVEIENDTKEEILSEELAQIYLKQGLYNEAKEIYNKLSLQYSEKSVYFAELTRRLSEKVSETK